MKDEKYSIPVKDIPDEVLPDEHKYCHWYWSNIKKGIKYKYWNKPRLIKFHTAIVKELFRRGFKHNYHPNSIDETLPKELKEKSKTNSSLRKIIQKNILKKVGEING